jgi:putative transposase
MKKSKFTEEQIAFAQRQAESGTRVVEVCRKMGISDGSCRWRTRGRKSRSGAGTAMSSGRTVRSGI